MRTGSWKDRTDVRLLAGLLAGVVPILLVLTFVLTARAGTALEQSARSGLQARAENSAIALNTWIENRTRDMRQLGLDLAATAPGEAIPHVRHLDEVRGIYDTVVYYGRDGRVRAQSRGSAPPREDAAWFDQALAGRALVAPIERADTQLRWIVAAPVPGDGDGDEAQGVVAGDIDAASLYTFVAAARRGDTGDALFVERGGALVLRSSDGRQSRESAMIDRGALGGRVESDAAGRALAGQTGALTEEDAQGESIVAGFAPVRSVGWAVVTTQHEGEALAAVNDQRRLALLIGLLGVLVLGVYAVAFSHRHTEPLRSLSRAASAVAGGDLRTRVEPGGTLEVRELGGSFNHMIDAVRALVAKMTQAGASLSSASAELASAAEELARTTHAQSAAATQTSSTMEELARTSVGIAETVGGVASRAEDAHHTLSAADDAMRGSSERMLALSARVDEITGLLALINDIADQTNLLAVNATIEAARAGEAGRGFRVVADEVRRLSERSKRSAGDIARMIDATRTETGATVMAMERTSHELARGLELMDEVNESTEQVRLTTHQQGIATEQVVETMASVSGAAGQTSATAQQIAQSAGDLNTLVDDLQRAVAAAGTTD